MQHQPTPSPEREAEPDPLAFTPVPMQRASHNGWTPRRQHDFIQALALIGNVNRAARAVGMTKQSAYNLLKRPGAESFAAAWALALQMGYDAVYANAIDRVLHGVIRPLFYRGKQVGTAHRYDHRLAMAVLAPPPAPPPRNNVARCGALRGNQSS